MKILVTGCGGGGVGEQILKALDLSNSVKHRFDLVGSDSTAHYKSNQNGWSRIPMEHASSPRYKEALLDTCLAMRIDAVIPGSEPELLRLLDFRSELEARGIYLSANHAELVRLCMNKFELNQKLNELGFPVPRSWLLQDENDLEDIDYFPVVIKPNKGGRGSSGVYIVQSKEQLYHAYHFLSLSPGVSDCLVQEYLGDSESEFTIGVLSNQAGEVFGSIGLNRSLVRALSVRDAVKNVLNVARHGSKLVISSGISQGRVGPYPDQCAQAEEIALGLGSTGPLNIQGRFVDGRLHVFEINPRYSGTTFIRALAGLNEPEILLEHDVGGAPFQRLTLTHYVEVERKLREVIVTEAKARGEEGSES